MHWPCRLPALTAPAIKRPPAWLTCPTASSSLPLQHRLVGGSVFLEATLENAAKGPIVMELVTFQPALPYTATRLDVQPAAAGGAGGAGSDGPLR